MDLDRPHHRTAATTTNSTSCTTSELFICFTSRLSSSSSSSMKFSKSILSPSRARDAPHSLPTSLSRRLKTNASLKSSHGQASPMFPSTTKKRGFENPEPSSPKVTCIGQVRVKTKKKVKQTRSLSKRRSGSSSGEVSFRKLEQQGCSESFNYSQSIQECVSHRNQRWVHLPLTICEALRAFGAEFSCLFPCRSSCFSSNEREKEGKGSVYREGDDNEEQRSCGAVFARWLVAMHDGGGGGRRRDIELVVAEEEECSIRSSRRHHVFEDIKEDEIVEMEKGRVSICIPPKNALLLMRCRSDPMKMAALTNRFKDSYDDVEQEEEFLGENKDIEVVDCEKCESSTSNEVEVAADELSVSVVDLDEIQENPEETEQEKVETCELTADTEQEETKIESFEAEIEQEETKIESFVDNENIEDNDQVLELDKEGEITIQSRSSCSGNSDSTNEEATLEEEEKRFKSAIRKEIQETVLLMTQQESEYKEQEQEEQEKQVDVEYTKEPENEEKESVLPECLLLMMCEPKLSMEVSKETWVCRRDFLRWLPERKQQHHQQVKGAAQLPPKKLEVHQEEQPKRRRSIDTKPPLMEQQQRRNKHMLQPPRSSCSLPAAGGMSMATLIEQKLVNAAAYEPFVLTRCKSEPMRTAAAKLTPESCFWKNRKIEPHRSAGVGAAGVGC